MTHIPPVVENDGVSEHYVGQQGEAYFTWQNSHADTAGCIQARLYSQHLSGSGTLVDFGAGGGGLLNALRADTKIAVEPNPVAREHCRSVFGIRAVEGLEVLADDSADAVISNHCLEHVPHPIAALKEMRRVLKPGGVCVICLPIDDWRVQRTYSPQDINHHLHTWTPLLFGHTLSEAGFTVVGIGIVTEAWPPGYPTLYAKLPEWLFRIVCQLYSVVRRRRQLLAVARK